METAMEVSVLSASWELYSAYYYSCLKGYES